MLNTPNLITALEQRGTLTPADTARLRQLHEAAPNEFVPRVMLKWLVNRGRLSSTHAQQILSASDSLSVEKVLDRVLGPSADLQLEPLPKEGDDYDEDTKDLEPALDDIEPMTLRARNAPPFIGSEGLRKPAAADDAAKKAAEPTEVAAAKTPPPKASRPAMPSPEPPPPAAYRGVLDEVFPDELQSSGGPLSAPGMRTLRPLRPKRVPRRWDSPLMLVGGAMLFALVLGGAFLLWRIGRQSGDDAFNAAEAAYGAGTYTRAVELYDEFLSHHPNHISVDRAVVHRGLAQLRLAVEGNSDWPAARRTAERILKEISPREEFGTAHADLGVLLADIAQGAARAAVEKNDADLVAESRAALELIDTYLPRAKNDVLSRRTAEVETLLSVVGRRLDRDRRAREAAQAVIDAVASDDFAAAYRVRDAVMADDAEAAASPVLREALQALASASARGVKAVADPLTSIVEERAEDVYASTVLTLRTGGEVDALSGRVQVVVAGGVAFALDARNGAVLWRRPIGFDEAFAPLRTSEDPAADTILHDSRHDELMIVGTTDGKLLRRIPLARPAAAPRGRVWATVHRGRLFLTFESGGLRTIDLASGSSAALVRFPQPLAEAVVVDPRGQVAYQFARNGTLYMLAADDLRCLQSIAVDYADDALTTTPLCVGPYLLLFERFAGAGRVRVAKVDDRGLNPQFVAERKLSAAVVTPAQSSQRYVAAVDLKGRLVIFDFSPRELPADVPTLAEFQCAGGDRTRRFLQFRGNQIWVAGATLELLNLQPTLNKLTQTRTVLPNVIAAAPAVVGDVVVQSWQEARREGLNVAAFPAGSTLPAWQVKLAAPVAAPPFIAPGVEPITALIDTGDGIAVYETSAAPPSDDAELSSPQARIKGSELHVGTPFPLPGDRPAIAIPLASADAKSLRRRLAIVERAGSSASSRDFPLPESAATEPAPFAGGIIVADQFGQVHLLDAVSGKPAASPFQPTLVVGTSIAWTPPAIADDAFFISDGAAHIYRVALEAGPQPRLAEKAKTVLARPLVGRLAVVGERIYAVDESDTITAYRAADLQPEQSWKCEAAPAWGGPIRAGDHVYVATPTDDGLRCRAFDAAGKLLWTQMLSATAWPPVDAAGKLFVVDSQGLIVRANPADGSIAKRLETGRALRQPAVAVGDRLLLTSFAGELIWVPQP